MNVGDIVRVKYTGESVMIRATDIQNGEGTYNDKSVLVSRAKQTRDGIEYDTSYFHPSELETVEANIDREFQEAMYRRSLIEEAEKDATLPTVATSNRVQ